MRRALGIVAAPIVVALALGCAPVAATSPGSAPSASPPSPPATAPEVAAADVAPLAVAPSAKAPASSVAAAPPPPPPPPEPEPEPEPEGPPPRPTGPPVRLVGPCIDTEQHAARDVMGNDPKGSVNDWIELVRVHATPDLDGDGKADQIRFGGASGSIVRMFFYVMRGKCGHHVGTINADVMIDVLSTSNRGLLDVGGLSWCPVLCCSKPMFRKWKFDGARYQFAGEHVKPQDCGGYED